MGKNIIIKGASFAVNAIGQITPVIRYYNIIYNLGNVTLDNSATSIEEGSSYQVTISAKPGYSLQSVTVKHNGQTVNPTSGNTYIISNVTGNITITAIAIAEVTNYTITYDLVNATTSNNTTTIQEGNSYIVTLIPNNGYEISSAAVTHNGQEVQPTTGYTYEIPSVNGNILVECVATESTVVENIKLTVLGKYDVEVTANQNENAITTSGGYQTANGSEINVLTNTDINVNATPTIYGETISGLVLNGSPVTSPIRITGDSVLAPKVKGNIAYIKYSGGVWSSATNPNVKSDSNHYRTEIFPVIYGEPLTIKIPNHASETVKIRTWYCSSYGTYDEDNSGLLSIELNANGVGTINPKRTGNMALHFAYASDYTATVFAIDDIKGIEVNYTTSVSWGVPAFKWKQVLDLGAVGSGTASAITWNQSAALYGKYMLTFSTTLYQIKVIDIETMKVVATVNNAYQADVHANSAHFLSKKYDNNDYYPMLITNTHFSSAPDKLVIYRLVGTTATSFTLQKICEWTFTNCLLLDQVVNDSVLYLGARAADAYIDYVGIWRIPMNWSDSSIYVDTEFDLLTIANATKLINRFYERTGQDWTIIKQTGKDDIIVNSYGPTTNFPNKHAGLVFYQVNATEGHLIGWLPTNRILNDYEHDGIIYAGNGVLYCVLIKSSHAYLYKFTITIPEYAE